MCIQGQVKEQQRERNACEAGREHAEETPDESVPELWMSSMAAKELPLRSCVLGRHEVLADPRSRIKLEDASRFVDAKPGHGPRVVAKRLDSFWQKQHSAHSRSKDLLIVEKPKLHIKRIWRRWAKVQHSARSTFCLAVCSKCHAVVQQVHITELTDG